MNSKLVKRVRKESDGMSRREYRKNKKEIKRLIRGY